MRKLLLPISLLLFLSSCDEQKTNIYNIVNDSSYPVTIVNYKDSARDTISLQKNEGTYSLSPSRYGRHSTPPPLYDFFHITMDRELSDSAKIYFDTSKVLNFYSMPSVSEPIDRNILDVEHSFQKQRCSKDGESCNFIYEITDEDYERAEWIVE